MPEKKLFCSECVEESHVVKYVKANGVVACCSYCNASRKTVCVEWLAEKVGEIVEKRFQLTSDSPPDDLPLEVLKDLDFERDGYDIESVICDLIGWKRKLLSQDIRGILESNSYDRDEAEMGYENPFAETARYLEESHRSTGGFENWCRFEESIRSESRFFNKTADEILAKIFKGVEEANTFKGDPVLRSLSPDNSSGHLYRARIVSDNECESALTQPDLQLGPPPSRKARSGRMNASGVSVFYGAFSLSTALAEVRPPVGSRVLVAKFDVIKELFVLDLKALERCVVRASYFSESYEEKLIQADVLRLLSKLCSKAVLPGDEEFDYLTTQALAEHLANNPKIDGIVFPSVQSEGSEENVALFHKSSRVQALPCDFAKQHNFLADCVFLNPAEKRTIDNDVRAKDQRLPTLEIDINSIEILDVGGVVYHSQSQKVCFHSPKAD